MKRGRIEGRKGRAGAFGGPIESERKGILPGRGIPLASLPAGRSGRRARPAGRPARDIPSRKMGQVKRLENRERERENPPLYFLFNQSNRSTRPGIFLKAFSIPFDIGKLPEIS